MTERTEESNANAGPSRILAEAFQEDVKSVHSEVVCARQDRNTLTPDSRVDHVNNIQINIYGSKL